MLSRIELRGTSKRECATLRDNVLFDDRLLSVFRERLGPFANIEDQGPARPDHSRKGSEHLGPILGIGQIVENTPTKNGIIGWRAGVGEDIVNAQCNLGLGAATVFLRLGKHGR